MSKTLKIRRVFVWAIYDNLKRIAPKNYPTTGEIKSTISDILPALQEYIGSYIEFRKAAEELMQRVASRELKEERMKVEMDKINNDWRVYNKEHGDEIIEVVLGDEGFKTLKAQFDREGWGKEWVMNIDEF